MPSCSATIILVLSSRLMIIQQYVLDQVWGAVFCLYRIYPYVSRLRWTTTSASTYASSCDMERVICDMAYAMFFAGVLHKFAICPSLALSLLYTLSCTITRQLQARTYSCVFVGNYAKTLDISYLVLWFVQISKF